MDFYLWAYGAQVLVDIASAAAAAAAAIWQ